MIYFGEGSSFFDRVVSLYLPQNTHTNLKTTPLESLVLYIETRDASELTTEMTEL